VADAVIEAMSCQDFKPILEFMMFTAAQALKLLC
jgi:hypothetical protein